MNDWIELDIDKNNIEYLSKVSATSTPKLPDKKDKERIKEEKNKTDLFHVRYDRAVLADPAFAFHLRTFVSGYRKDEFADRKDDHYISG